MLHDYQKVKKERVSIILEDGRSVEGMFVDLRIDPATIPDGHKWYQIRHADDDWVEAISIKQGGIMVNFYGTLITDVDLELNEEIDIANFEMLDL